MNSVSWAPTGEYFAVGSYDTIRLCNKTGWTHSFNKVDSGGIMSMSWTSDGTVLSAAAVFYLIFRVMGAFCLVV